LAATADLTIIGGAAAGFLGFCYAESRNYGPNIPSTSLAGPYDH
jgi:hypothetical protein